MIFSKAARIYFYYIYKDREEVSGMTVSTNKMLGFLCSANRKRVCNPSLLQHQEDQLVAGCPNSFQLKLFRTLCQNYFKAAQSQNVGSAQFIIQFQKCTICNSSENILAKLFLRETIFAMFKIKHDHQQQVGLFQNSKIRFN